MLAIDPRPGNATSNCAADNIALLDLAVSRLPGRYRRREACGHVDKANRPNQAVFRCVACGHRGHADVIAAGNILRRGLASQPKHLAA